MTSLLYSSGLNFQGGNPLGRKVRALEAETEALRKEVNALKSGGVPAPSAAPSAAVSSSVTAELDAIKRELAMMKLAGFGKGEKGEKGDKGDKGDPGPMTYIAMPATAPLAPTAAVPSVPAPAPAPTSA